MDDFALPELCVGDKILWHDNPMYPDRNTAAAGIISRRPGKHTASVLIWGENTGWMEKMSVRHKDDPFWKTSEMAGQWAQWGCFELHPETEVLKEIRPFLTRLKMDAAKGKKPAEAS